MSLENFIFDFLKSTESAAYAAYQTAGCGDNHLADNVAVKSMRQALNDINADIEVVIGEGERDQAPMLYIGEKLGKGGLKLDLAVDPLEGTNICANYQEGALAVLAYAPHKSMLNAPDIYMEKFVTNVAGDYSLCINNIEKNLKEVAKMKKCNVTDLKVIILNRDRHKDLISRVRKLGAKIKLIEDGDIAAILNVVMSNKADVYIGVGGAPEGVLAAVTVKFLGGTMLSKLIFNSEEEKIRANNYGIVDFDKNYAQGDLISDDAVFIATGVTSGPLLNGPEKLHDNKIKLESLIVGKFGCAKISRVQNLDY